MTPGGPHLKTRFCSAQRWCGNSSEGSGFSSLKLCQRVTVQLIDSQAAGCLLGRPETPFLRKQ